jgi:hypothetical protein
LAAAIRLAFLASILVASQREVHAIFPRHATVEPTALRFGTNGFNGQLITRIKRVFKKMAEFAFGRA